MSDNKIFDCGCQVNVVYDDSQGENYSGNPTILFDFERCGQHSRTATDSGPIGQFITDYSAQHPMAEPAKITSPRPEKKPIGCGKGNHDYQMVIGKNYAKCSKCISTKTVSLAETKVYKQAQVER